MLRAAVVFPFGDRFRPGRCIAVAVGGESVQISGEGIVPTTCNRSTVVPVLMLRDSDTTLITSDGDRVMVRALSADQFNVGVVDDAGAARAAELFPSRQLFLPRLNLADPLPGPGMAWSSLDAVILNQPPGTTQTAMLLTQGVTIAVASEQQPSDGRPWRREGGCWALRPPNVGIISAIGGEAAYEPITAYQLVQPARMRRQIVLAAVLVSLLMLATLLVPGQWMILVTILVFAGSALSIESWRRKQSPIQIVSGEIVVQGELTQRDRWSYSIARRDTQATVDSDGAWPIVVSEAHAQRIGLTLTCDAERLVWQYELKQSAKMAFLSRSLNESRQTAASASITSPLDGLARAAYVGPFRRIVGHATPEHSAPGGTWPMVIIGVE